MRLRVAPVEYKACGYCLASRAAPPTSAGSPIQSASGLARGTYLIHKRYGLGISGGVVNLSVSGLVGAYIVVEYAEGGKIYVPLNRLANLLLYTGPGKPQIASLASTGEYEGVQCPWFRHPFEAGTMRKLLHERLILVGTDVPVYEQVERCKCPACKDIYSLPGDDITRNALCSHCNNPLFTKDQLKAMWRGANTLLQRARALDRARKALAQCPQCHQPVQQVCWCPISRSIPHPPGCSCLPQRPTLVWVRTFAVEESVDELERREWLES